MLPRLSFGCLLLTLGACAWLHPHYTRPNVAVLSVELRHGTLLQQSFALKLNVQNPNDRPLPVRSLHAELKVGGEQIATGVADSAFVVPAHGELPVDMTITANLALALFKLGDKINQHGDSIDYQLDGAASVELPFARNLPFHQSGSLPLRGN
jgi:LEA14-like dessication related protein